MYWTYPQNYESDESTPNSMSPYSEDMKPMTMQYFRITTLKPFMTLELVTMRNG